jgi:MFS family permease
VSGWTETLNDVQRRGRKRIIPLILGLQFVTGIIYLPVRSFLPVFLKENIHLTVTGLSLIMALGQILAMVTSMVSGSLSHWWGRKRILLTGMGLFCLGPLMLLSGSLIFAALMAVLFLSCTSFLNMGGMGSLIAEAEPVRLGFFSALYHWGITLGGVIGGLAAGFILDSQGYDSLGLILFSLALVAGMVILVFFPGQGIIPKGKGRTEERGKAYLLLLRDKKVLALGLFRFLPTLYWGMASVLISLLIKDVSGSNAAVALYGSVSSALATLAQVVVGKSSDAWGSKTPLILCFILLIISVFGLSLFPQTLWTLFVFGSLAACAAWSLSTMMPVMIKEFIPTEDRDRTLGFIQTAWSGGMVLGALGGGFLFTLNKGLPFAAAALLNGAALFLLYRFYERNRY